MKHKSSWIVSPQYTSWPCDSGRRLADAIVNGKVAAVSDGSHDKGYGSSAWMIVSDNDEWSSASTVSRPGMIDADPYRYELNGLYSSFVALEILCLLFNITEGSIKIACDCDGALNDACTIEPDEIFHKPHFDLLSALIIIRKRLPVTLIPTKVEAHKDERLPLHELSDLEIYNVDVDRRAKLLLASIMTQPPVDNLPLEEYWAIKHNNVPIVKDLKNVLYEKISSAPILEYYIRHGQLNKESTTLIDWDNQSVAIKGVTASRQRWITKFVTNTFGVGIKMKQWKKRSSDSCPHCGQEREDNLHVLQCTSEAAGSRWDKSIAELHEYMIQLHISPQLTTIICEHITAWREKRMDSLPIYPMTKSTAEALKDQYTIGWTNFMIGRISKKWKLALRQNYSSTRLRQLTSSLLIRRLYLICFQMWDARNKVLHDKSKMHKLHGIGELNRSINLQLDMGKDNLLPTDNHLINIERTTLLGLSREYKVEWLKTIEAARTCKMPNEMSTFNYSRMVIKRFLNSKGNYRRRIYNKYRSKENRKHKKARVRRRRYPTPSSSAKPA